MHSRQDLFMSSVPTKTKLYENQSFGTAQKMKILIKDFFSNVTKSANLVAFTEDILNAELNSLFNVGFYENIFMPRFALNGLKYL